MFNGWASWVAPTSTFSWSQGTPSAPQSTDPLASSRSTPSGQRSMPSLAYPANTYWPPSRGTRMSGKFPSSPPAAMPRSSTRNPRATPHWPG